MAGYAGYGQPRQRPGSWQSDACAAWICASPREASGLLELGVTAGDGIALLLRNDMPHGGVVREADLGRRRRADHPGTSRPTRSPISWPTALPRSCLAMPI